LPEIDFFLIDEEQRWLTRQVLELGSELVPDLRYRSEELTIISTEKDFLDAHKQTRLFFLLNPRLTRSPLQLRRIEKGPESFFYVAPRVGGPTVQFFLGSALGENTNRYLSSSFLSLYPWYENTLSGIREKPSCEFVAYYYAIAALAKGISKKIKPGVRPYWLSSGAEEFVRKGGGLVGLEQFPPEVILTR